MNSSGFASTRASGCVPVVVNSKIVTGEDPKAARGFVQKTAEGLLQQSLKLEKYFSRLGRDC